MAPPAPCGSEAVRQAAEIKEQVAARLELPDESWIRQSGPFPSVKHFFDSAFKNFEELLEFTELGPTSQVLDYGCGLARLAIPMSGYLDPEHGRYCGVDTDAACIERNRRVFNAHPNFRFEHIDIYSKMYNLKGGDFSKLLDSEFGGPFDLVFMFSVFTHILPEHCDLMLEFLRSQLKAGGQLFCSWFLLNERTQAAIDAGQAHRRFASNHGPARIDNPEVPEGAVAYFEEDVMERLAAAGFTNVRVHWGKWRGCFDSWVWQDIVVVRA